MENHGLASAPAGNRPPAIRVSTAGPVDTEIYDRGMRTASVEPLDATFGAVVHGVDLVDADEATTRWLTELWLEFALLVFPDQHLSRPDQDAFARRFGDLEFEATALTNITRDGGLRSPDHDLSKSLAGNEHWHHDSTYMPVQAKGAVFSAEIVPTDGGTTGFADMRAAHDALDEATRSQLDGLAAFHSRRYSMERAGHHISDEDAGRYQLYGYHRDDEEPPLRPLVKTHPVTGRRNLVIGQHAHAVTGMPTDASEALLDRLTADACVEPRTYFHEWTVGDALLWDNRCLMHRATAHDPAQARRMWHTRIAGDPASESAINV